MRRVVVTGIGIISPIGIGSKAFWDNLLARQVGVKRIASFDPAGFPSQIAAEVPAYRIVDYVPKSYRKATKVMARDIELAVVAADDAFKDSGIQSKAYTDSPTFDPFRFGCNIGAGLLSADLDELTAAMHVARAQSAQCAVLSAEEDQTPSSALSTQHSALSERSALDLKKWGTDGMGQLTPLWLLKYLPNMLACHVTIVHGLKGPSNTITCQEASSHLAIGEAYRTIQRGDADLAICGGAESNINPMGLMRQCLLKRTCDTANDHPAEAVRPFDESAAGMALGEGGGLFIIEEYEHARARGAKMYAELVGFGASQDTYRVTDPSPTGHSYSMAIKKALAEARIAPGEISCYVPHGLGVREHDRAELAGLKLALGESLATVPMCPIKAQIGNLAAGSGVDAAAAVLAIHGGKLPAAVNTQKVVDGVRLNVSNEVRDATVAVAVSSVYSLGGQNAALVFRRV